MKLGEKLGMMRGVLESNLTNLVLGNVDNLLGILGLRVGRHGNGSWVDGRREFFNELEVILV